MRERWIGAWALGLALTAGAASWAQAPEGQRVPQPSPAVEGEDQREAQDRSRPPQPPPVPVLIIKSPAEAESDAARETKSDEHDAKDLDAQIRAANAAEKQISPAWAAAVLSGIATILVIANIMQTSRANKISLDAYIADQRPWVSIKAASARPFRFDGSVWKCPIVLVAANHGKSPALNVDIKAVLLILPPDVKIQDMLLKFCQSMVAECKQKPAKGEIVFPGKELDHPASLPLVCSDPIESAVNPALLMCVTYSLPARMGKESVVHHSAKACFIGERGAPGERPAAIRLKAKQDQSIELAFFTEFGTSFAD